ncbi:hypothetical protein J7L09_01490 [bacterium]|nr:hypothetical protein [bacterium]
MKTNRNSDKFLSKLDQVEKRINDLEIKTGKIEVSIEDIKEDIRNIKDNHLSSIYEKLDFIEKKIYQRPGWLMTVLISILSICITFILTYHFK